MATYFIAYDLIEKEMEDYEELYTALEELGAKRVLLSNWYVKKENTSCREIKENLLQHMEADDRLLVVKKGEAPAWSSQKVINLPK